MRLMSVDLQKTSYPGVTFPRPPPPKSSCPNRWDEPPSTLLTTPKAEQSYGNMKTKCPHCGSLIDVTGYSGTPDAGVRVCAEEGCELKVYCDGWCHTHFLAQSSISTKREKAPFAWG